MTSTDVAPPPLPRTRPAPPRFLLVALGYLVASALAGIVWWAWAPTPSLSYRVSTGSSIVVIPDETENQVAADGRYLLIVLILAVALVAALWRVRTLRGPALPLAAGVLALAGAEATALVGSALSSQTATVNSTFTPAIDLHAWSMIFGAGFLAAFGVTVLALASSDEHLGRNASPLAGRAPADPAAPSDQATTTEHGGGGGYGAQLPDQFQFPSQDPPGRA